MLAFSTANCSSAEACSCALICVAQGRSNEVPTDRGGYACACQPWNRMALMSLVAVASQLQLQQLAISGNQWQPSVKERGKKGRDTPLSGARSDKRSQSTHMPLIPLSSPVQPLQRGSHRCQPGSTQAQPQRPSLCPPLTAASPTGRTGPSPRW